MTCKDPSGRIYEAQGSGHHEGPKHYEWSTSYGDYLLSAKALCVLGWSGLPHNKVHSYWAGSVYMGLRAKNENTEFSFSWLAHRTVHGDTGKVVLRKLCPYVDLLETRLRLGWKPVTRKDASGVFYRASLE